MSEFGPNDFYRKHTNIMEKLVPFSVHRFARAPFTQTLRRSAEEGRRNTVVEVWARSVQCVSHGVRSKFFLFGAGVDETITRGFLL